MKHGFKYNLFLLLPVGNCKDIALLVFHHKDVHALPSQTSDKILTGTEFSHVGLILDFAFLTNRGIYNCELNTLGIERIVTFLLQYKTRKWFGWWLERCYKPVLTKSLIVYWFMWENIKTHVKYIVLVTNRLCVILSIVNYLSSWYFNIHIHCVDYMMFRRP